MRLSNFLTTSRNVRIAADQAEYTNTNSSVHDKNICKIPKKDSTYISILEKFLYFTSSVHSNHPDYPTT